MGMWAIEDTAMVNEGSLHGWMKLNAIRNRDKELKAKKIVFIDDSGNIHHDINNPQAAKDIGLLEESQVGKEKVRRKDIPVGHLTMAPKALQRVKMR